MFAWNRWYLPSVGRYLELDPIAKAGGFNGFYGPNWYVYAEGNPLSNIDPWGLLDCHPGESTLVCKCRFDPSVCQFVEPRVTPDLPWWLRWLAPAPLPFFGGDDPPPKPPTDCPPTGSKPCECTCLGPVNPDWNPDDSRHGDRNGGQQPYPTACREECTMRGFGNSQCR